MVSEKLPDILEKRMDAKRLSHTIGCAKEAVRLAELWGLQKESAYMAGMLHDVTKALSFDQQLKLCEKYDITPCEIELSQPALLHAVTGAEVAADEFKADADICSAIRWHTTGHSNMTLLEKIIWLSDFIEPSRNFPGVNDLRKLAYKDINQALIKGFDMSIDFLIKKRSLIHPDMIEARNYIIKEKNF